jgi:hypothetical protein
MACLIEQQHRSFKKRNRIQHERGSIQRLHISGCERRRGVLAGRGRSLTRLPLLMKSYEARPLGYFEPKSTTPPPPTHTHK